MALIELKRLGEFINNHPNFSFHIEHHTDNRGDEEYNLRLSQHRANSLLFELQKDYEVDTTKVKAVGLGESTPIISPKYIEQMNFENKSFKESHHSVNRRTLLRIIKAYNKS